MPFRRRWWAYLVGVSAIRLSFDFFSGDLPTRAGLSPQQLVAVGVLVALGVIGVRNAGQRLSRRPRRYGDERVFARSKCTPLLTGGGHGAFIDESVECRLSRAKRCRGTDILEQDKIILFQNVLILI